MNLEERIEHHRRMALGYGNAYLHQVVQEGEEYEDWTFADDAVYSSPYFTGEEVLKLSEVPTDAAEAATMEAKAYSLTFPDWKPADFRYWPAPNGLTMKVRWQGTMADGTEMGFYSYSFVETNERGEVARWETHVNDEYSAFLDVTIGVHGPFHGHSEYVDALRKRLAQAGVEP
jgi:phytoene dehydrogenase-like protein